MIWNSLPTQNQQPDDLVLGQTSFGSTSGNSGASGLNLPRGVFTDGTRLLVADPGNNRVLLWKTFPKQNGTPADVVFGQPDFVSNSSGTSYSQLNNPTSAIIYKDWVYIADSFNHRIVVLPLP